MSKSCKSSSRTSFSRQDWTTTQQYLPREKKPPSSANRIDRPAVEAHTKKDRKDISLPNKNREIAVKEKAISRKNECHIKHEETKYEKKQTLTQKISGDHNKNTVVVKQYEHTRVSTVRTTMTTNTTAQKFSQPPPKTFKTRIRVTDCSSSTKQICSQQRFHGQHK